MFQKALEEHGKELKEDVLVSNHLDTLYNTLLEENLTKVRRT